MSIQETREGYCHTCKDKTGWMIVHRFLSYNGVCHCLKCTRCGSEIPDFCWHRYQEEGKVVDK